MGCRRSKLSAGLLGILLPSFLNCVVCKFLFPYDFAYLLRFVSLTQSTMYGISQVWRSSSGGASSSGGLQVWLSFPVPFQMVNVPCFMHSNSRTIKVTGYRLTSTALTLCLVIAKFSLSAENNSGPSNYLDLAGFLIALMCVLEMPESPYSYTDY